MQPKNTNWYSVVAILNNGQDDEDKDDDPTPEPDPTPDPEPDPDPTPDPEPDPTPDPEPDPDEGFENVESSDIETVKLIQNGNLFIRHNGRIYNILGY